MCAFMAGSRVSRGGTALGTRENAEGVRVVVASPLSRLTPREREILALVEAGCSNKQIARQLDIRLATAKNHVHNILEKLGVRSRGEAAAVVRRTGNVADQERARLPFLDLDPIVHFSG